MNRILTLAFGGIALVAASTAYGQEPGSQIPNAGYMFGLGPDVNGSGQSEQRSLPLFTLGELDIHVWAPMQPHYNANANRDPAAEPFWNGG
jgi:hypothetical protein